jgi:hypothetical protein
MLFAPQLATRKKKMNMEKLMLIIQIESMQDVHAKTLNGLHHGEDNVHIQGRELLEE